MRRSVLAAFLALAASAAASGAPHEDPYGVHIGVAPLGSDLVVQWFTRGPSGSVATVEGVGDFPGTSEALPGGAGYVHSALLAGLGSGPHTYTVGGEAEARTTPATLAVPPREGAVRLAFLGDQGTGETARATAARLAALEPDAVLHAGDLSYAEGNPAEWDAWFALNADVMRARPWLPALGNHETYYLAPLPVLPQDAGNPEVDAFRTRFALPGNELHWSTDLGDVHVAAIDTFFTGFAAGGEQAGWLERDLAATSKPWKVVLMHEPPYSSNAAHGSNAALRAALEPIVERTGVDLVVTAHDHAYERTHPLRAGEPATREAEFPKGAGAIWIVTGGGGQGLYSTFEDPAPPWSAARVAEYHVLVAEFDADGAEIRAVAHDGATLDRFAVRLPLVDEGVPAASTTRGAGAPLAALTILAAVVAVVARPRP